MRKTRHKFENFKFSSSFYTENVILRPPYNPEVLILGTFNPDDGNFADFFYGRNFFWPIFRMFYNNTTEYSNQKRSPKNLSPSLNEILDICSYFKLSFADLVLSTDSKDNLIPDENVLDGNIEWNTQNIINFINNTPSLKFIYFTRQKKGDWKVELNKISQETPLKILNIYTPSGQSLKGEPRILKLKDHWLFNDDENFDILNHSWLENCGMILSNLSK